MLRFAKTLFTALTAISITISMMFPASAVRVAQDATLPEQTPLSSYTEVYEYGENGLLTALQANKQTEEYTSSSVSEGQKIAAYARSFEGCRYSYGGESPKGFDCSGFMFYLYGEFGYDIKRTATAQLANGYEVAYEDAEPGDILYFGSGSIAFHVGMYLGNDRFIHAENSGTGVVITDLTEAEWYADRLLTVHRIVE